ncbi:hypothetical protein [Nocardia brasiliensis]|uniref:hypothetical protein n=1 Tax=Nocardia brasiliensis TaxID=37326 RepID=UPI002453C58A|nr:hypothetical protein [Nocardia brasiliensis]
MVSRYRVVRLRRWLAKTLRRARLNRLAAAADPGQRVRLWDAQWNLLADSDREHVDFATIDLDGDRTVVYEPSTTVRWSGRIA